MSDLKLILGDYDQFFKIIFKHLENTGIKEIDQYEVDHLCYRVTSEAMYQQKKIELSKVGDLLTETMINGRPISVFKLNNPIQYQNRLIPAIELPCPKPISHHVQGLEHMEMVINCDFDSMRSKYSHIDWVLAGINKSFNADLEIEFTLSQQDKLDLQYPPSTYNEKRTISVKFHHLPLEKVVEIEKQQGTK
ncbi:dihydroxybiphenyl dioxygenase domain-containing protein [Tieghemostelium lacteum]|uniref:Dihydroxybiphenyl dioxygenase domain-containing protein n=1 Tax=Tieghemostelium lacteum TaxID=361077 RepID=A0A151ZC64_TIELA|nr:dihydroxybiphenyl dioxygenase domain-containing protein [Tieghemostelium lacteum]|eukprot:KYQ91530.1 dihydroxybiphenyl dioxygenase domain-containing protein [Tieghemostelium lacteum]